MQDYEVPMDCFKTCYTASGSTEEIEKACEQYKVKYPYMQYGTRRVEKTNDKIVLVRWTNKEDLIAACIHTPVENPIGPESNKKVEKSEQKGADHTVFQVTNKI